MMVKATAKINIEYMGRMPNLFLSMHEFSESLQITKSPPASSSPQSVMYSSIVLSVAGASPRNPFACKYTLFNYGSFSNFNGIEPINWL